MSTPENGPPARGSVPESNSFDTITIIVEGNEDTTRRPLPPHLKIWAEYERDRAANPTTPRPYRPYLEASPTTARTTSDRAREHFLSG